jgi:hypothetical protein
MLIGLKFIDTGQETYVANRERDFAWSVENNYVATSSWAI